MGETKYSPPYDRGFFYEMNYMLDTFIDYHTLFLTIVVMIGFHYITDDNMIIVHSK
jgi:hypothetical protein